jgi:hypothetical protein
MHAPYKVIVPCALKLSSAFSLDTVPLANGVHEVEVAVVDASGQRTGSGPIKFTVENDHTPPVLSKVSLSRTRFRASKRTVMHFTSSEAGQLSISIARVRRGKKPKLLTTLTDGIAAGKGSIALSGRIGKRPLAPGDYRLTISASDAVGNRSGGLHLSFAILPG